MDAEDEGEGEGESGEVEEAGRVRCVDRMSEVRRKYDNPIIGSGSGFKRPHTRGSLAYSPHLYCLRGAGGGASFTRVTVLGNVGAGRYFNYILTNINFHELPIKT